MAGSWVSTKYPGVYYREHHTRKHGLRKDRYFAIKYARSGKPKWEACGWASEGYTLETVQEMRGALLRSIRSGAGPQSLAELRTENLRARAKQDKEMELRGLTFARGAAVYGEWAKQNAPTSWKSDEARLRLHVLPTIGDMLLSEITTSTIEGLKATLAQATTRGHALSPGTILKILTLVGTIFNHLADTPSDPADPKAPPLFQGRNPARITRKAGKPGRVFVAKSDNARMRVFSAAEVVRIMEQACIYGQTMHDVLLLAFDTGLRAGEIAGLRGEHIGPEGVYVATMDTKTRRNRTVFPRRARQMLLRRKEAAAGFLFPARDGGPIRVDVITNAFERIAARAWLNLGVEDARLRGTFHGTRHWFGGMEYLRTRDLHHVQVLLGHDQIATTQRYVKYAELLKHCGEVVHFEDLSF